jgi:hypothetical protein
VTVDADAVPAVGETAGVVPMHHAKPPWRWLADAVLVTACGVLLIALGYTRGRTGTEYAAPFFWAGQVLIFTYVCWRALKTGTSPREREFLVLLFAAAQSVIRWLYSPHGFTFSDELQHFRSLENVLTTNHLFAPNYNLPISPRYPGLQNVTAELVQVTGAGPFFAGTLIAAVSHVLLAACLLLLFREVTRSTRIACIAVLLYLLNPHASYFDTSFLYETAALPFVVLSMLFAIRFAAGAQGRAHNFYAFLACVAVVTVTHHVSALVTVVLIGVIAVVTAAFRDGRHLSLPMAGCAAVAGLVVACWVLAVAPITLTYLGSPVEMLLQSLHKLTQFRGGIDLPGPPTPAFDRILAPAGVLVMSALIAVGVRNSRQRSPMERAFAWIALAMYLGAVGMRAVITNGAELSGRLLTFAAVFTAVVAATTLRRLASAACTRPRWLGVKTHLATATALSVVLFLSSIVVSMPPWWGRIPGEFHIEGYASGIDRVGTSRAQWAAEYLRPGSRYFSDLTGLTLLSTIGELDPVDDPGTLYYTATLTPEDVAHIKAHSAIYVDVDLRMSRYAPINGKFFPQDVMSAKSRSPIPIDNLTKFDGVKGLSRIYDSGQVRTYDLRGGGDSPYAR